MDDIDTKPVTVDVSRRPLSLASISRRELALNLLSLAIEAGIPDEDPRVFPAYDVLSLYEGTETVAEAKAFARTHRAQSSN